MTFEIFQEFLNHNRNYSKTISQLYDLNVDLLVISKSIIELHNGTMHVESKEGIGTTFTFMLPISL